jgi:hypothetical protein
VLKASPGSTIGQDDAQVPIDDHQRRAVITMNQTSSELSRQLERVGPGQCRISR